MKSIVIDSHWFWVNNPIKNNNHSFLNPNQYTFILYPLSDLSLDIPLYRNYLNIRNFAWFSFLASQSLKDHFYLSNRPKGQIIQDNLTEQYWFGKQRKREIIQREKDSLFFHIYLLESFFLNLFLYFFSTIAFYKHIRQSITIHRISRIQYLVAFIISIRQPAEIVEEGMVWFTRNQPLSMTKKYDPIKWKKKIKWSKGNQISIISSKRNKKVCSIKH